MNYIFFVCFVLITCFAGFGLNLSDVRSGYYLPEYVPVHIGQKMNHKVNELSNPVPLGALPWIVSLISTPINSYSLPCCGTILNKRAVLTAAQCVLGLKEGDGNLVEVHAGSLYLNKGGQTIYPKRIAKHPKFNESLLQNDLALLIFTEENPVPINNSTIAPINLARVNSGPQVGKSVYTCGFDRDANGDFVLQNNMTRIMNKKICEKAFKSGSHKYNNKFQICAKMDDCLFSIGCPLYRDTTQLGIYSYTNYCGTDPIVYTRVSKYLDWIKMIIA